MTTTSDTIAQTVICAVLEAADDDGCRNPDGSVFAAMAHIQRRLAVLREMEQQAANAVEDASTRVSANAFEQDGWLEGAAS